MAAFVFVSTHRWQPDFGEIRHRLLKEVCVIFLAGKWFAVRNRLPAVPGHGNRRVCEPPVAHGRHETVGFRSSIFGHVRHMTDRSNGYHDSFSVARNGRISSVRRSPSTVTRFRPMRRNSLCRGGLGVQTKAPAQASPSIGRTSLASLVSSTPQSAKSPHPPCRRVTSCAATDGAAKTNISAPTMPPRTCFFTRASSGSEPGRRFGGQPGIVGKSAACRVIRAILCQHPKAAETAAACRRIGNTRPCPQLPHTPRRRSAKGCLFQGIGRF